MWLCFEKKIKYHEESLFEKYVILTKFSAIANKLEQFPAEMYYPSTWFVMEKNEF